MDTAKSNEKGGVSQEPQAVVIRKEPEKELLVWKAAARPFKRRDKQFFVTTFSMAGIVSLILFLAEGVMPVLLIISLVFLYYVLSTVEPEKIEYKLTNKGVKMAGNLTPWGLVTRFWFIKRFDSDMLVLETMGIPGRMELVVNPENKEFIKKEASAYAPFEEVNPSNFDKFSEWVSKKIPGNK